MTDAHFKTRLIAFACVFLIPMVCMGLERAEVNGPLLSLADQYRLPRTLHCKAITIYDFKAIPPGICRVDGTQEFWADGNKYRILQLINNPTFPGMSQDVRWDGQRFQWFNVADATLIFSSRPNQKTPYIGEPIPLLPVEFLNPSNMDLGVKLSLADLQRDGIRRRLQDETIGGGGNNTELILPGGKIGSTEFTWRIMFAESPSYLPSKITRMATDGVALSTTEISYQPVQCAKGLVYLPHWARLTNRTADNRVFVIVTCEVTSVEADIPIAPETFTLDFQNARSVIDLDHPHRRALSGGATPPGGSTGINPRSTETTVSQSTGTGSVEIANPTAADNSGSSAQNVMLLICGLSAVAAGTVLLKRKKSVLGEP